MESRSCLLGPNRRVLDSKVGVTNSLLCGADRDDSNHQLPEIPTPPNLNGRSHDVTEEVISPLQFRTRPIRNVAPGSS